jgi:hypothetical protein
MNMNARNVANLLKSCRVMQKPIRRQNVLNAAALRCAANFQPLGWSWVQVRQAALSLLPVVLQAHARYLQCHSGSIEADILVSGNNEVMSNEFFTCHLLIVTRHFPDAQMTWDDIRLALEVRIILWKQERTQKYDCTRAKTYCRDSGISRW